MKLKIINLSKINDEVIDDKLFNEQIVEYEIRYRENLIDDLIDWIAEAKEWDQKEAMKEDLKYLISLSDEFILSSNKTNNYAVADSNEGQEILKEIIKANKLIK